MPITFIPKNRIPSGGAGWLPKREDNPKNEQPSAPNDSFLPTLKKPEEPTRANGETRAETATLSLSSLNAAQQAALDQLPPVVAGALHHVWDVLGADSARAQLLELLEKNTLTQADQGQTVAESLQKMTAKPRGQGIDAESLTRQSVALLAQPNQFTNQGINTYTCGAANLQFEMAENPARLARFIEDITDGDGQMTFAQGETFVRPQGAELEDNSGRNSLNRIVQSTLMNFAGSARGPYDPSTDTFADGEHGLKMLEVARTAALLEGEPKVIVHHNSDSSKEFHRIMKSTEPGETFQVGVSWNDQDHLLVFTGQENGDAHFFNAQDSTTGSMPMEKFLFKTQFAVFGADKIEGADLPQDSVFRP